jgi:hypothetical protein
MDTEPRRADPLWTLDELVERAGRALSTADTPVSSGRARQLPDRRAVRWYASTGLVDRPGVMRGRVALYGPRQLLQLVAIKRRQAQGARLADIQAELAGAGDAELAAIAAVPPDLLAEAAGWSSQNRRRVGICGCGGASADPASRSGGTAAIAASSASSAPASSAWISASRAPCACRRLIATSCNRCRGP